MLNTILALSKCILDFILIFWFSKQFFCVRWENRKYLSPVVLIILALLLHLINSLYMPVLNTCAALSFILFINFFLFKGPVTARLICTAAEAFLSLISEFIPVSVYSLVYNSSIPAAGTETIKNAALNLVGTCILGIIIFSICHVMIWKRQNEEKDPVISNNFSIIAVPLISILMEYYVLSVDTPDASASLRSIFFSLGLLLMNMIVIFGDNNSRKRYQLQRELDRLSRLEEQNRIIIGQQDQFIEEMKGFVHDYTKQLEGIKRLVHEEGSPVSNELQTYSHEMLRNIEESCRFAFIPSPALRAILIQTQLRCNFSHIKFETDIQYAEFSFIAFPDLYTLFENPLENAITACNEITDEEAAKYVRLRIFKKKHLIWVEIKNPKVNPIVIKEHCIQTTKKDEGFHGHGLKNMKRVTERYGGYMNIDYSTDEFSVTMAFPEGKEA